ncbi:glycogen synthase [Tamlana sp. 2_MG-2023]|uniref:glycogen synthase n=1 Tax=unclassified Tamlana TaxID=2614803 RepID=UPI0026E22653|nr:MULTISPECIES: glycogen synthase [unclassified Tamlana]MDO6759724.1 glycogen synthase [Tamlana sp. 2_MG-2023]MDO6791347.1 glycogen synthase [Tamlana sp. 1_MG-2023]
MNIIHISAECYPIAKVGGLADVVGALPKYQNSHNITSQVIMPFYDNAFTKANSFVPVQHSSVILGDKTYPFRILVLDEKPLDFDVFFIDIPDLLFKDYVYSSSDTERFLAFQMATLDWLLTWETYPDIIHCHDHHTGLIPFMLQESFKYEPFRKIPNIFTIHNAQYQGWFSHDKVGLIPPFNFDHVGLLDWGGHINPLAAAIKCAWSVTTVSPSYMEELKQAANGLEHLLSTEHEKCTGILNGIDNAVWNPETDHYLVKNYNIKNVSSGAKANKKHLCETFNLDPKKPLFAFIGRLVYEKGSDIFPEVFKQALEENDISILLLGSGNPDTEAQLEALKPLFEGKFNAHIGYDEQLSHIVYAGADFLLMPSRVEPCGLNQMYALRYGTIPVVRSIGGLKDTVIDIEKENGFGICHQNVNVTEITEAINRGVALYKSQPKYKAIQKQIMEIDHSWDVSANDYINLYNSIKN